jgi:hypothetical protein
MIRIDDRTPEQKKSHTWGVVGRDTFLSGWGEAKGGYSRATWACKWEDIDKVERWVRNRSDMIYVNVIRPDTYRPPRNTKHYHIYVVDEKHPALN